MLTRITYFVKITKSLTVTATFKYVNIYLSLLWRGIEVVITRRS